MIKRLNHGVTIDVLGGAVPLPRPADTDLRAWALHEALARLGAHAGRRHVKALATALEGAAVDTAQRETTLAFAFCPQPERGELARIEVTVCEPDETAPHLSLNWFADRLSMRIPQSLEPAQVTYDSLPIGPAVRVSARFSLAGDGNDSATVLQTAAWAAMPPGHHHGVLLHVAWQRLELTDRLNAMTDKLARSLRTATAPTPD